MTSDWQPDSYPAPTDDLACAEDTLRVLQQVLRSVSPEDFPKQTPCPEFDVAGLSNHLLNTVTMIGRAVNARIPPPDPDGPVMEQVIGAAQPTITAWKHHGVEGVVDLGANEAPANIVVGILAIELLVHAWDCAVAIGEQLDVPESLAEYVLGLAQKIVAPHDRPGTIFGEPVAVPDDAGALDRLIAYTGRTPVH